jgi:hypothetical protein
MFTGLHAPKTLRGLLFCFVLFASACNLRLPYTTPSAGSFASDTVAENTVPSVQPGETGFHVEILSPLPGAEVPAGEPLTVTARCTGGEAIEAMLSVDSKPVATLPASIPPGQEIKLVWLSPTEGKHSLTVEFLDTQKASHAVDIYILVVVSAVPTAKTPTPGGAAISFLSIVDGSTLTAGLDSAGFAQATVTLEAEGDSIKDIILEADGLQVARAHNDSYSNPFHTDLAWTPYRGNGKYTLTAYARTADLAENHFRPVTSVFLTVDVEGIPSGAPSVRDRFIRLYSDRFGLSVPIPPLARYIRPAPTALDPSRWVSVAYIGNYDYEINLMDDGSVQTTRMAVNHIEPGLATICRSTGTLDMLVVFVDYGNTGIAQDPAFAALADAQSQSAGWHQTYAASHGLSTPLLKINTTPAWISASPTPGEFLTAGQIQSLAGFSTRDYDLVAQVDLDSGASLSARYHGLGFARYGGCLPGGSEQVNLFMTVQTPDDLASGLYGSLLVHELSHDLGWQHWWPTGVGGANDQLIWNYNNSSFAYLFFGWTDVDGDGTIELFDPNPYGR